MSSLKVDPLRCKAHESSLGHWMYTLKGNYKALISFLLAFAFVPYILLP